MGGTNILFKNMKGFYSVYQCPNCLKVVFLKVERKEPVYCCECNIEMKRLELKTAKVEIEI